MFRMTRLLLPLAAIALLTACGPQSIEVELGVDVPPALRSDTLLGESGPGAAWTGNDREAFVVVLYGSSSCAPIPTELAAVGAASVALGFAQNPSEFCTSDLAANTYRFVTPEGVAAEGAVELVMEFETDDGPTTSRIPIID